MASGMGRPLALVSGAAVLILGAGLLLAMLATSRGTPESAGRPGPGRAPGSRSAPGVAVPSGSRSASGPAARPAPGTSGDGYARNIVAGATCAPVGALGFTGQARLLRCAPTDTDPHPRWRTP